MRPALTLLLCVTVIGTVWGYSLVSRWLAPPQPEYQFEVADGSYSIDVTTNYDLPPQEGNVAIVLNGKELYSTDQAVVAGKSIQLADLTIRTGSNHLFSQIRSPTRSEEDRISEVEAFLEDEDPVDNAGTPDVSQGTPGNRVFQCVRVRVFRDGQLLSRADVTSHVDSRTTVTTDLFFSAFKSEENGNSP